MKKIDPGLFTAWEKNTPSFHQAPVCLTSRCLHSALIQNGHITNYYAAAKS